VAHTPHPHYLAPPEAKGEAFEAFLKKLNGSTSTSSTSASSSSGNNVHHYNAFWEVPNYAAYRLPELSEIDIEDVMSGGAARFTRS